MKAIIVDDEVTARRALRERCSAEPDIEVIGEYADAESAFTAIAQGAPDVVFLDIKIGRTSGMQLARSLNPSRMPLVVFVTAYDRYALQAFDVGAVDFLLKPFDRHRFQKVMYRLRERSSARNAANCQIAAATLAQSQRVSTSTSDARPRVLVEMGGALHMLDVAQIELVTADRNYVVFTVGKDSFHARSTLRQAEEALRTQPLLRINRSTLVNVNHVMKVSRTARGDYVFILSSGTIATSSERFRHKVRQHIGQFVVGDPKRKADN